jgi:hypothetical protein
MLDRWKALEAKLLNPMRRRMQSVYDKPE